MPASPVELLERLLSARSLAEAGWAASAVIDVAVSGGRAAPVAAEIVRLAAADGRTRGGPYRAHVLAVLLTIATWGPDDAAAAELAAACAALDGAAVDPDPEVRGVFHLLLGAAGAPPLRVFEELRRRVDREPDPLAHACAVQGLVKAADRVLPVDAAGVASALGEMLVRASALDLARVRVELGSSARSPAERRRVDALVSPLPLAAVVDPRFWPAESV